MQTHHNYYEEILVLLPEGDNLFAPLFKKAHWELLCELLGLFNAMFLVTQQSDETSVAIKERVHKLGLSLITFLEQRFSFAILTLSVHQICAHLSELF